MGMWFASRKGSGGTGVLEQEGGLQALQCLPPCALSAVRGVHDLGHYN